MAVRERKRTGAAPWITLSHKSIAIFLGHDNPVQGFLPGPRVRDPEWVATLHRAMPELR